MRLLICWLLLAVTAAAAQDDPARTKVAWLNGTAEADTVEIHLTAGAKLSGHVVVHLEQFGTAESSLDLTADKVTVITKTDAEGKLTINKIFAVGRVHVDALQRTPSDGTTMGVVSDCEKLVYLAVDQTLTLSANGAPVVATMTQETTAAEPTGPDDKGRRASKQTLVLTGRESVVAVLKATKPADLEPPQER